MPMIHELMEEARLREKKYGTPKDRPPTKYGTTLLQEAGLFHLP